MQTAPSTIPPQAARTAPPTTRSRTWRLATIATAMTTALALTPRASAAYQLPVSGDGGVAPDAAYAQLESISKATANLAKAAKKALVFISVAKSVKGMPLGQVDPFDFFFGPRGLNPRQRGGRGAPQQPQDRDQMDPSDPQGQAVPNGPRQEGLGSGFFVDVAQGYVITNNHVVEDADEIHLKLANGETYTGKVVGRDDKTDVAVVKVTPADYDRKNLGELRLGNSDAIEVGNFVMALGAPFGLEASISQGVVSATGRGNLDIAQLGDFIQTDAAINPGNSGGPLLNTAGEVVGMNTAIYSKSGSYNGIGFAVPSNIVRTVADQLINGGKIDRGYLGLSLQELGPDLAASLKLPTGVQGALVSQVQRGSPALKAGFEAGDVIVKLNERPVSTVSQVTNTIGLMKPGSTVGFAIYRNGVTKQVTATVGGWPNEPRLASSREQRAPAEERGPLGLGLADLDGAARAQFQLQSDHGVVITSVAANSPSARVGLRPGDLIVAVDNRPVANAAAFADVASKEKKLLLRVERAGDFFFVPLKRS